MPDWQTELEALLSRLQVSLDHTGQWPPAGMPSGDGARSADPESSGPWDLSALAAEELPVDGDEVSAVRSEIEATVEQLVALVNSGRIETTLRDDVIFVLQALTRPHPSAATSQNGPATQSDSHSEWHLATAAAVLRFCRIVQRLTFALAREAEF